LRWHIERDGTQIHFAVRIDARDNEENSRTTGTTLQQAPQTENDSSFIFLHYLISDKQSYRQPVPEICVVITLMHKKSEMGNVAIISSQQVTDKTNEQTPGLPASSV
jgi:hypothetical protein